MNKSKELEEFQKAFPPIKMVRRGCPAKICACMGICDDLHPDPELHPEEYAAWKKEDDKRWVPATQDQLDEINELWRKRREQYKQGSDSVR